MQEDYISLNEIDENITVKDVYTEAVASKIVQDDVHIEESVYIDLQSISHADLSDRTLPNQHTIASVQGLRDELDRLEFAHTHVSGTGYAQYYPWVDSEPVGHTDRIGCFVSFVDDGSGKIKLCSSADEDILGVIVSEESAGFIGNAIDSSDISKYGLVCLLGTVDVRVTDGIQVGDYIVPNALGIASGVSTTESYAQIITITNSDYYTLNHTPIANPKIYTLDVNGTLVDEVVIGESATGKIVTLDGTVLTAFVGDDGYHIGDRLCALYDYVKYQGLGYKVNAIKNGSGVSYATIGLIPNGNALHRLQSDISNALDRIATLDNNAVAAMNRANDAYNLAELVSGDVNTSIFEQIQESIDKSESANNTANDAVNTVNQMSQTVVNIENVANNAKKEAEDNSSEIESLWAENGFLQQDIQSLRGKIDKYAVGPYSQAYGLTFDHATKILPTDIVYVPTENHDEQYQKDTGEVVYHFSRGYSYVWDGSSMLWSPTTNVLFYGVYISGDEVNKYWYTDCSTDVVQGNTTYPKKTLFVWSDGEWIAVATLDNNTLSRVVSLVQQTENDVKIQITDVRGNYANISARVEANETAIENVAKLEDSIAGIQQRANKNEASIEQFVQFGYEVLNYEEIDEAPTNGPFYIDKPEWDGEKWVFTGSSSESVGNINGIEYCYAKNEDDTKTYCHYICGEGNQWYVMHIGRAAYIVGIEQKASQNEASLNLIVSDICDETGKVNGASIAMKINEDEGSEIKIRADHIDFEAGEYTIDSSHFELTSEQVDVIASKINLNGYVKFEHLEEDGQTTINGSNIKTGVIDSNEYAYTDGNFSDNGTSFDLTSGAIISKNFAIDADGNSHFAGTIHSPSGEIGGFVIGDTSLRNEYDAPNSIQVASGGSFTKMYMSACDELNYTTDLLEVGGIAEYDYSHVYVGTDGVGTYRVNRTIADGASCAKTYMANGKLFSNSAEITGKMTATEGYIGDNINGFEIKDNAMRNVVKYYSGQVDVTNPVSAYMTGYNTLEYGSTYLYECVDKDFIYIGTDGIGLIHTASYDENKVENKRAACRQTWMADGKLFSNSAEITGTIVATDGEFTGKINATSGYIGTVSNGFAIGDKAIRSVFNYGDSSYYMESPSQLNSDNIFVGGLFNGDHRDYVYVGTDGIGIMRATFNKGITAQTYIQNGNLFSNSAEISGKITVDSGYIGNFAIENSGLTMKDVYDNTVWVLNDTGIHIPSNSGVIEVGNLQIYNNLENGDINTNIRTIGDLIIRAADGTGIRLGGDSGSQSKDVLVGIMVKNIQDGSKITTCIKAVITNNVAPIYDLEFDVVCRTYENQDQESDFEARTVRFKINAGSTQSNEEQMSAVWMMASKSQYYHFAIQAPDQTWISVSYDILNAANGEYRYIAEKYNTYSQKILKEEMCIAGHLIPDSDGYDIGANGTPWRTIYAQQINISGSNVGTVLESLSSTVNDLSTRIASLESKVK